jgi:hypothetical protein
VSESNRRRWLAVAVAIMIAPELAAPAFARPTLREAIAAHYAPGVMERVARVREMPPVECMISSPWHDLGEWVRIESLVNDEVAVCRTTDVSAPEDHERHLRRRLVELDWPTAQRLCDLSAVGQKSPRECPVLLEDWEPAGGAQ